MEVCSAVVLVLRITIFYSFEELGGEGPYFWFLIVKNGLKCKLPFELLISKHLVFKP